MLIIDKEKCIGCGVCEDNCAFGAIEVVDGCAVVNDNCTLCGACVENCEPQALRIDGGEKKQTTNLEDWSGIWIFAEFRHDKVVPVAFELLGVGRKLADERGPSLTAVLFGAGLDEGAAELIAYGADAVLVVDDERLRDYREDVYAGALEELIKSNQPEVVLAGATAIGRSFIPMVANALGAGLTADCTQLSVRAEDGMLLQTRPAFGGNIMATIECPHARPQMATVRPRVMAPLAPDRSRSGEVRRVVIPDDVLDSKIEVLESVSCEQDNVHIQEAEILVAGGRGLEDEKGFALIRKLADELGGAVAASRAAVDAGWISYPHQVGQTGKTVAPRLYIACGISGAVQHAVGMQSAETIVAINRDEKAPIFDLATYCVVGDLFEIVPLLTSKIKEVRGT